MQPRDVVIVSACRTAIGKFQGQFKDVPARELAITAGKEAIRRAGVDINTIDEIVMGECYTAMQGSLPARQVSMRIGLPIESSAVTVNQNCASGMRALEIACNNIQLGKTEIGLVVGVENMTQAPFLLPKARMGYRMGGIPTEGGAELYDSLLHDALYDALVPGHMGVTADNVAKLCNVSREECDKLAVISHNRACAAIDAGKFKDEIVPVVIHNKKKGDIVIDTDEHPIRNCSYETISKMKAVFTPDGVTTAANASGINDAAAAVIVMSADKAKELGIKPMAKMINMCSAGVEPKYMGIGPAYAIPKVPEGRRHGLLRGGLLGDQRGLCRPVPGRWPQAEGGARLGSGPGQDQCQRFRHLPGAPHRLHRPADHCLHALRNGAPRRHSGRRLPVCGRRPRHGLPVDQEDGLSPLVSLV